MLISFRSVQRSLFRKLVALTVLATSAGPLSAANTGPTPVGPAPVLVPYTVTAVAGNNLSSVPGYGADGVLGLNTTLNGPNAMAVDSVGNVYFVDQSNALIREINAQTGIIKTIAGQPPTKCTGTTCTVTNPGCSDGVIAVGNQVGARMNGLVVDGYGNVYFSDYNYQGVWVIYKGGAQVASFISLVDNATAPTASAVKPGYIYHIAGLSVPKAGGGCTSTSGLVDQVLATSASFHDPLQMGIDAPGNLYVQDFANNVVRVINTQATAQTFFGVTVQPGFVASIVGCNAKLTATCPATVPPFGGPAGSALFSNVLTGMTTDQYGNIYEIDGKAATGSIYAGVAYNAGSSLAHLINLESGLTATKGNWYEVINSITNSYAQLTAIQAVAANGSSTTVIRPVSIAVDQTGNLYMLDSHWLAVYRVDVNSQMATRLNGLSAVAGTPTAPAYCAGTAGPQSIDSYGDGCPIQQAKLNSSGTGYVTFDGAGNLYIADTGNNIIRKVSVGTQFASTAVGSTLTQTLQLHFDAANLPATSATSGFAITSGSSDYTVGTVTCSNYTTGLDASVECYVPVTFAPSLTGTRSATLQATTANGSIYPFALTGFGAGPQIAVDGGASTALTVSGLGSAAAVATDAVGNTYIADSANNQVVFVPASGAAQSTIGSGIKTPQGVAVDAAGNVYVADSGNSRIVEIGGVSGIQTTLTTAVKNPHGLAVDASGNVYVADTGNARVLEIPAFGELAASPLLAYSGAQALVSPVAVAIDKKGNILVADSGNSTGLIQIAAGGGDLQTVPGGTTLTAAATVLPFGTAFVTTPSGIAIDGAGNLYVSDSSSNNVQVIPSSTGPGSEPYALNFKGLSSPGALALSPSGNLYVADTGNNRVVYENRSNVTVNFGIGAQFQPAATAALYVTNIGTTPITPATNFVQISGATADFAETDACRAANFPLGTLGSGLHCTLTPSFLPVVNGPLTATASVQSGAAQINLIGTGENPLVKTALAVTAPTTGVVYGSPATVTLTASQPNGGNVPTGTVTFNYTVNGVAQAPVTQTLVPGSGSSTANLTLNNLLAARVYVINAMYNGDASDSVTNATPLTFTVPGLPITIVANSVSYSYGSTVPTLTGTVTGILPADQSAITVAFVSGATSTSPVGTYPITVTLTGGNAANYTIPNAVTPAGAPAIVTENQAPLSILVGNASIPYGSTDLTYALTVTGLVNGDSPAYTFTPPHSIVLNVGTYTVIPTASILTKGSTYDKINNYKLSITNGTLVVTQGQSVLGIGQPATAVLPTALTSAALTITAAPPTVGFFGTPTGKVTLQDVFTPLTATGNGTTVTEPLITLTLAGGVATYTPTDPTLGNHVYTFTYSGDSNFSGTNTSATPNTLTVDNADFTVVSTTSPIQVAPGIIPGGVATTPGELAATPETATVYIGAILGSTQTVNLTCAVPTSYITCTLSPASLTLAGKTLTSVVSVSTPATLPINYTSQVQNAGGKAIFAAIPFALLALLPIGSGRRKRLTRLLLAMLCAGLMVGASGCGGNSVKFFTPVPAGPSQVVITGTSGSISRSFTVPINVQ